MISHITQSCSCKCYSRNYACMYIHMNSPKFSVSQYRKKHFSLGETPCTHCHILLRLAGLHQSSNMPYKMLYGSHLGMEEQ